MTNKSILMIHWRFKAIPLEAGQHKVPQSGWLELELRRRPLALRWLSAA